MSCIRRELDETSSLEILRQSFGFSVKQETPSLPPPPVQRVYNNKYYSVEHSSKLPRTSDVLKTDKTLKESELSRETSKEKPNKLRMKAESLRATGPTQVYRFNPALGFQPFVGETCCRFPCCEIPSVCRKNFAKTYEARNDYLRRLRAFNTFLVPNIARMAYEREKLGGEGSAKDYEVSVANKHGKLVSSTGISREQKNQTKKANDEVNAGFVRARKNGSGQGRNTFKIYNDDVSEPYPKETTGQKRNFESFVETHDDRNSKHFKSNSYEIQNTNYYRTNSASYQFRRDVSVDKQINTLSFQKNSCAINNGLPTAVAKGFDMFHLQGRNVGSKKDGAKTISSLSSQTSGDVRLQSVNTQLSTGRKVRHGTSPCPGDGKRRDKAEDCHGADIERQLTNDSSRFISLDSTKASFLSFVNQIRVRSKDDAIACPYCGETFTKYPDLRNHVQTHKDLRTSAEHSPTDMRGERGESLSPGNERDMTTTPDLLSAGQNSGDDSNRRGTSVIMFAGQKKH